MMTVLGGLESVWGITKEACSGGSGLPLLIRTGAERFKMETSCTVWWLWVMPKKCDLSLVGWLEHDPPISGHVKQESFQHFLIVRRRLQNYRDHWGYDRTLRTLHTHLGGIIKGRVIRIHKNLRQERGHHPVRLH